MTTNVINLRGPPPRLTPEQYRAERASIVGTYGDNAREANAMREQAWAELFVRSGWTQQELAEREGVSQQMIAYRLRFGRFLNFTTAGCKSARTHDLSEGLFRKVWARTDKEGNEAQRFVEVVYLLDVYKPEKKEKIVDENGKEIKEPKATKVATRAVRANVLPPLTQLITELRRKTAVSPADLLKLALQIKTYIDSLE